MIEFTGCGIVPGVTRAQAVESDRDVPSEADVVVIGGGLLGCIAALNLAERGLSVALCEKGVVAGEASGRAVGLVEYELLSPVKMELIARSIELWHAMPERVNGDMGYSGPGLISLYEEEEPAEFTAAWLKDMQGQPGVEARMLTDSEIGALDGALGSGWYSALHQANGAAIEPCLAAPAIARAARAQGVTLLQSCAVRSIERQGGAVAGVITEKGSIKTTNVIIAGGVWSSMLAAHLGLELPQMMIFAEQCSVEPVAGGPAIDGMTPAGYYRREPDGGYLFAAAAGRIPITMSIVKNIRKLMAAPTDVDQDMSPVLNLRTFFWDLRANRNRPEGRVSHIRGKPDPATGAYPRNYRPGRCRHGPLHPCLCRLQGARSLHRIPDVHHRQPGGHLAGQQHPRTLHRRRHVIRPDHERGRRRGTGGHGYRRATEIRYLALPLRTLRGRFRVCLSSLIEFGVANLARIWRIWPNLGSDQDNPI